MHNIMKECPSLEKVTRDKYEQERVTWLLLLAWCKYNKPQVIIFLSKITVH